MKYAMDASSVVDLLNGQPEIVALQASLLADGLALSILVYMEVLDGVYHGRDPKAALAGFNAFLRGVTVLPFSRRAAQRAARLRGALRDTKRQTNHRAIDILIAATALQYGLIMVTSDSDYDDIPGLTALNPRTGQLVTH